MLTLNQIVRRIKTIALQHKQLRNFYFGNVTDFLEDKKTRYASLFLQDNQGSIDVVGKIVSYNFKMFILDLENVSDGTQLNTLDVQSDMSSIATDLLAEFDHSDFLDWKLSSGSSFGLVREYFDDFVAGIVVDLTIQVPYDKNTCAVPNADNELTFLLYWAFFNADPYGDIQNQNFGFSKDATIGSVSYALDFTSSANQKYLAVKELATESEKLAWYNTLFNNGSFPDQVFRDSVIIGPYRYYVSRIPVVIDSTNTIFTLNV